MTKSNDKILFLLLAATIVFTSAGCSSASRDDAEEHGKNTASKPAGASGYGDSGSAPTTSGAGKEKHVLEDKYYQDADGNFVPDFVETEFGYDPNADDCPLKEDCAGAPDGSELNKQVNTLLMLDSSGSMRANAGGARKIDAAKDALKTFVAGAPDIVKMGFLVYGHKGNNTAAGKQQSCAADGAEILAPVGAVSSDDFDQTLSRFEPTGWTPIGLALEKAREAFAGKTGENRIIMVSDGIETCGGNPVEVARQLHSEGINVKVDVVGFGVATKEQAQLRQIAEAGGGEYFDAKTRSELDEYFKKQDEAYNKVNENTFCLYDALEKMSACEQEFTMKASDYLGEEIKKLPPDDLSGKYGELILLNSKLLQNKVARIDSYTEIRDRIKANNGKLDEISAQKLRALGKKTK